MNIGDVLKANKDTAAGIRLAADWVQRRFENFYGPEYASMQTDCVEGLLEFADVAELAAEEN